MKPPSEIDDLIALSCALGGDPALVQGGGGNLSLKSGDAMWVKASGFWLAEAREKSMYVPVGLAQVRAAMRDETASDVVIPALGGTTLRPSIETTLHAALPHPVVVHVHSVAAIAWTVREGGRAALDTRLSGLRWAWVPYARPGLPLTRAIAAHAPADADVLVLANHGIVAGGGDCAAAAGLIADIENRLALPARPSPPADAGRLAAAARATGLVPARDKNVHGIAADPVSLAHARRGPLYPDHVVFLGMDCPVAAPGETPPTDAPFVLVDGAGVLVRPDLAPGALAMLGCWADVLARLPADATLRPLSEEDCCLLLGWEAEDYRRKLRQGDG